MTKSNRFSNLKTITWILKIKRTFRAKVGKKCTPHFSAFLGDKNVYVTIKPLLYVGLSYKITMKFLNIGQSEKHCGFLLLKNVCYCRMSRCWLQHAGLPDVPFKPHAVFVSCLRNCVTPTQGAAPHRAARSDNLWSRWILHTDVRCKWKPAFSVRNENK